MGMTKRQRRDHKAGLRVRREQWAIYVKTPKKLPFFMWLKTLVTGGPS